MQKLSKTILFASTIVASAALVTSVRAQAPTIDGSLDASYGSALAVQTANTGFGNGPASSGGNQLDAGYGTITGGNLYLFFAGNTSDGNFLDVFVADGRVGQSVLNVASGGTVNMNGSVFSPGFSATLAVNVNTYAGTMYPNAYDLVNNVGGYTGSGLPDAGGTISGAPAGNGIQLAVNESSAAGSGVNTGAGALTVTTGWEMAIPLSLLGNTTGPVEVMADINGNPDNYLSNQFLPGIPDGTGNVGGGGPYSGPQSGAFNFGSTPGEYFTVVPEPSSIALVVVGLFGAIGMIRRRKA